MNGRRFYLVLVTVLLFLVASTTAAAQEKAYLADYFDVETVIEPGGSLLVTERVSYAFSGEPFTYVFREIPTDLTDGVTILSARLDGRQLAQGSANGQVEISGGDPVRVTWHFEPTTNRSRTFELVYRMDGVVRQDEGSDLLRYQILPDDYAFPIERSENLFRLPAGVSLLGQPTLLAGNATLSTAEGNVTVTAAGLAPGAPLVVAMRFPAGSIITAPPAWQAQQTAQQRAGVYWIIAAALVTVGGAAVLLLYWQKNRVKIPVPAQRAYEPPAGDKPALAGALVDAGSGVVWAHALGTLFDLADRGAVTIAQVGEKKWYRGPNFAVHFERYPQLSQPHERALLDLIFEGKLDATASVELSELGRRITSRRWKSFEKAVEGEMQRAGYLSEAKKQVRKRLLIAGIGAMVVGFALIVPLVLYAPRWGLWPLALLGAFFLLALLALGLGMAVRPLSAEGAATAGAWQGFADYLKDVTRGNAQPTQPDDFERYLPYAAAFGLLERWARHFADRGWTDLPPWFHALTATGTDGMGAFVALAAVASSSGGSAAGAAGAGAAGAGAAGGGAAGAG